MEKKEKTTVPKKTVVFCPWCGRRTSLRMGSGDAVTYCYDCKIEVEVNIHVIEKPRQERNDRVPEP